MNQLNVIIVACIAVALTAGCASSPSRFYTLSPVETTSGEIHKSYAVSVGPVSVPAAVDRLQIVTRTGPNEVFINEFDRWASPLKVDIARVVAANLASILGTPHVTVFPATSAADPSFRVEIDVMRFESEPGKTAALDALWTVRAVKGGQERRNRTSISEPAQGSGYAALAAAHSRALGRLSSDIAAAIREMDARPH